jgi:hypothetical protein
MGFIAFVSIKLVVVGCNSSGIVLVFAVRVNVASLTSIIVRIVAVVSSGFCGLEFCESGCKVICGAIIDYRVGGRVG